MKDAIERVRQHYPELTSDDLATKLPTGGNWFANRVQWVRQALITKGEVNGSIRGIWKLTEKGKERIEKQWNSWRPRYSTKVRTAAKRKSQISLTVSLDPYENLENARSQLIATVQSTILERLRSVSPEVFENTVAELLQRLGYGAVKVVGRAGDAGIDGECTTDRLGLYKAKFQAKRWQGVVGSKEVRDFIGALDISRVQHGIFVTTSSFSSDAKGTALKSGRVTLVDGETMARLMVETSLGVRKVSQIDVVRVDEEFFAGLT